MSKLNRVSGLWTRTGKNRSVTMSFVDQTGDRARRFVLLYTGTQSKPNAPIWAAFAGNPNEPTERVTGLWPTKAPTGTVSMSFTDPDTKKRYVLFLNRERTGNQPDWIAYHDPVATASAEEANAALAARTEAEAEATQPAPEPAPTPAQPKRVRKPRAKKQPTLV